MNYNKTALSATPEQGGDFVMTEKYDHRDTYKVRLILAAVALALFVLLAYLMTVGKTEGFDESLSTAARSLRGPVQNAVLIFITNLARWTTICGIGAVLLIVDAVRWHKIDYPLAVGACLINLGTYSVLKRSFQRIRPDESLWLVTEHGFSFPSGHTMNGMFCYGMMIYLIYRNIEDKTLKRCLSVLLGALIPLIGFSRVYLGVHYPSDVMAGALCGFGLLMLATVVMDELLYRYYDSHHVGA